MQRQITTTRRHDIDWLRVIGMLGVFLFHGTMFLNPWDWHVKNAETSLSFAVFSMLINSWVMPLFFVAAGAGSYYALQKRNSSAFLKERIERLLVPIVLGAFVLSPHQVYVERLTHGDFSGDFWAFLPHYFEGWYIINGNFAWMGLHLWFLLVLFVFTLVLLPVMSWWRSREAVAGKWLSQPVVLISLVLPFLVMGDTPGQGGFPFLMYLVLFLYGYVIAPQAAFREGIQRYGLYFLILGVGATVAAAAWVGTGSQPPFSLRALSCWAMLLGLFWIGERYLQDTNMVLEKWSPLVMPFYVLHQPVIVAVAYWMRDWPWWLAVKYVLLMAVSFACILVLMGIVQRVRVLRYAVGMKESMNMKRQVCEDERAV